MSCAWSPLQRFLGIEDATITLHEEGVLSKPLPERVRLALEELGPTFVKFGQIVSSRRDFVTDEYYVELCKLQTEVPPFPADKAKSIIAEELGKPVSELFKKFDDKPVGSASIAQVHAAQIAGWHEGGCQGSTAGHRGSDRTGPRRSARSCAVRGEACPGNFRCQSDRRGSGVFLCFAQGARFQQRGIQHRTVRRAICQ